jgi:hypothetical protein
VPSHSFFRISGKRRTVNGSQELEYRIQNTGLQRGTSELGIDGSTSELELASFEPQRTLENDLASGAFVW